MNSGAMWPLIRGDIGFNPTHEDMRSNQNAPLRTWYNTGSRQRKYRHPAGNVGKHLEAGRPEQVEEYHELYGGH